MTKREASQAPALLLFRHDLRIADNRAMAAAADTGRPVIPVFILDETSPGIRPLGGARRWWLHGSLTALSRDLKELGAPLLLRRGAMDDVVRELVHATNADCVFWNRRYDPAAAAIDARLKADLRAGGVAVETFDGQLLHEPTRLKTGAGTPYKVYSAFWRAFSGEEEPRAPVDRPTRLRPAAEMPAGDELADWRLLPEKPDWAGGLRESWQPGEDGAHAALDAFIDEHLAGYEQNRDIPARPATSRLSPHLATGEITPFQIFDRLRRAGRKLPPRDLEKFRQELGWREFCYHLLFHNGALAEENYNKSFDDFPWGPKRHLRAWQRGETGYPIVDAGMRELWQTGVMHNRVRMIVASFLSKHLLIDWREGETWFWDTLVDADAASNPANWQWVAGSGADAAPYFRVFNPILQGEKFDPKGEYVRGFVPELEDMPAKFIHRPWAAPEATLADAGVTLGQSYPRPVVDHDTARQRALAAYQTMRGGRDEA